MLLKVIALAGLSGWWAFTSAAAADEVVSLRDRLTPEEFERAGLNKLTAAELDFLSRRLAGLDDAPAPLVAPTVPAPASVPAPSPLASPPAPMAAPVPAASPASAPAPAAPVASAAPTPSDPEAEFGREARLRAEREKKTPPPKSITSRLPGEFTGWTGRTVFRLENGQVWQQAEPAEFSVRVDSPVVTIERRALGSFYLSIEGYGSRVRVTRVR